MFHILFKYFSLHQKLSIPGIGCFVVEQEPARVDFANGVIQPATCLIKFNNDPGAADKHLFEFISKEKSIDEIEAIREIHEFSYQLKQNIKENKSVNLPYIGALKNTSSGFEFEPAVPANYYTPVAAELISRDDAQYKILVGDEQKTRTEIQEYYEEKAPVVKKDYWWIYTIVLAVIAISAIVYYYYSRK